MVSKFNLSPSSLILLRKSPKKWYEKYILKEEQRDSPSEAMINGSLIHCLLGNPEEFEKKYLVVGEAPSSKMMQQYLKVKAMSGDLVSAKEMAGYAKSTSVEKVEKEASKYDEYFRSLINAEDKILISKDQYEHCKQSAEVVKQSSLCKDLLAVDHTVFDVDLEVFKEHELSCEYNELFGLKGILDSLVVDKSNKLIKLVDIKTTSTSLVDFPTNRRLPDYLLQMSHYTLLVLRNFENLFLDGYRVNCYFVVVDGEYQAYPFLVSEKTLEDNMKNLKSNLDKAVWHISNGNFELPYELAAEQKVL